MDELKAELQKQKKQDFALKKIHYIMSKNELGHRLISSLSNWSQGRNVLEERAANTQGVATWDIVLHEWFRVRDFNNSGDFDEEEYVHFNSRMHSRYFDDNVPFDEQKHRDRFKLMDTNQVSLHLAWLTLESVLPSC